MKQLYVLAEGQAEEGFINRILLPHLLHFSLYVQPIVLTTRRDRLAGRVYRGGVRLYTQIETDIRNLMHRCSIGQVWLTTMLDLYALPDDFPGRANLTTPDPYLRVKTLEQELSNAWGNHPCLLPYIQLHEFEALLLSDVDKFDWEFIEDKDAEGITKLKQIVANFASPEEINEGESTAPSKRIIECLPRYAKRKASSGPPIAEKIGLETMRHKCPHFNAWIERLEELTQPSTE